MSAKTNSTSTSISPQEPTMKPNRSQGSGSFGEAVGPRDQIRPAIENVYDSLDDYFLGHDLDKPLSIETSFAPSPAIPPPPFIPRQTMMESSSAGKLRRRGTKLWDNRVQQVLASDGPEPSIPATSTTRKLSNWWRHLC
jgi:hypothetical protein